jgi:hypothetical protein
MLKTILRFGELSRETNDCRKIGIAIISLQMFGLWGEIRDWEEGSTIVQKTHDAGEEIVKEVGVLINQNVCTFITRKILTLNEIRFIFLNLFFSFYENSFF